MIAMRIGSKAPGARRGATWMLLLAVLWSGCQAVAAAAAGGGGTDNFPLPLTSYAEPEGASLWQILEARVRAEPFNLFATVLFFLAIAHTFMASTFMRMAHRFEHEHHARLKREGRIPSSGRGEVSFKAQLFHFLGEIEAIFGIWVVPLLVALTVVKGWHAATDYFDNDLNFTEPLFVVVVMSIAASRPILLLAERSLAAVAVLGRSSVGAWWLSILTIGPLLGSFITEPAAMTICASLLARRFYRLHPNPVLSYATIGLLFVNISVGGTLTHFAAPPVLMVAGRWGWGMAHMLEHFGWKAVVGIAVANICYFVVFRRQLGRLGSGASTAADDIGDRVPVWITLVHVFFLVWTVLNNHSPALFLGGFLFYLAFTQATEHHQGEVRLRPALLVGFFLAGLVTHGGLQGWWIQPVLSGLSELPLFFGAVVLTAFNDNAAITYLASLVPGFGPEMKYAVVAGAVVGGGLTVIANAPNPAGQSILSRFFPDGVSAGRLLLGALFPTAIMALAFLLL